MRYKKMAFISIALNVLIALTFVGKRFYFSHSAPPPSSPAVYYDKYNDGRVSVLDALPIDSADVVFVGNSITEQFPLEEIFHSPHVKNRGIGANQTRHILGRIRAIALAHPKAIIFEMGVNDIREEVPLDSILANYERIVNLVQQLSPNTALYIQAVFPVTGIYRDFEPAIDRLNVLLTPFCRAHRIPFLYFNAPLSQGDYLDSTVTFDGLHLNGKGYAIVKEQIIAAHILFRE